MPNRNGSVYGLTILSPIINDERATPSHDLQIRRYLATLPTGEQSPFAIAPGTHLARLVVMDDVIYVGAPACEEHLKSKYLVFETNCDSDLPEYINGLAERVPEHLDAVWSHCVGYPGAADKKALIAYMLACQIDTTFFFAAVNDKTVPEALRALLTQRAVTDFIVRHQGMAKTDPARLQAEFVRFAAELKAKPTPPAGARRNDPETSRAIKTGGHNE
jgi:hypothetical protein